MYLDGKLLAHPEKNYSRLKKIFYVRRTPKVSLVGVILRAEIWFSRTSAGKFEVCVKPTFRMQNDTNSANFRYIANKKYRSYHGNLLFFNCILLTWINILFGWTKFLFIWPNSFVRSVGSTKLFDSII